MGSLKEVKNRINSVKSTRQITSAMKMVASAKLHKAQSRIENMLPYQCHVRVALYRSASCNAGSGRGFLIQQFAVRSFQCECGKEAWRNAGRIQITW